MDRGAWRAIVHEVAKESDIAEHTHRCIFWSCISETIWWKNLFFFFLFLITFKPYFFILRFNRHKTPVNLLQKLLNFPLNFHTYHRPVSMCRWETTRRAALVKSIIQNWNSYFIAVKSEMQQGPLRTLPIAPESKHFKRKVCITGRKKSGHLQPSTNWGFVTVPLIFSNWLQGQLTSRVLSAMIISSWLWWENLAVKYFLGLHISTENIIKAHRWEGTRWLPALPLPAEQLWAGDLTQDTSFSAHQTGEVSGSTSQSCSGLREILPTKSSVQWVIHTERSVNVSQSWPHIWQMAPLLGGMKARPPVLTRSCMESRALQTQGGVSITRSRRTSWKVVSTAARSWLCPQSRCGEMLPFFHIKPNFTVFHINTNLFPVLAPVTDPDFTLTESHLYHHLTQLRSSRNKKLIWLRAQFTVWQHKPGWFWLLTGAFGDLTMWGTSPVLSWQCGPGADHSALCFRSPSATERLSVCCLPSWRWGPTITDEHSRANRVMGVGEYVHIYIYSFLKHIFKVYKYIYLFKELFFFTQYFPFTIYCEPFKPTPCTFFF